MTIFLKKIGVYALCMGLLACNLEDSSDSSDNQLSERHTNSVTNVQVGPRPYFLVDDLPLGNLKTQLENCGDGPFSQTDFSIGHRGAAMQFPEHTKESYMAAARLGAGIIECDVTFTADKELVCRHSQCDLHTTTNILATSLADSCSEPFVGASNGNLASAKCCTSDITLAEFKTLKGKMDGANANAQTVDEYLAGTANWRTDLYASDGTLMTHKESIELFKSLGVKMTPELKAPAVEMPFDGFSQQDYASKMINEYIESDVASEDVFAQSFNRDDVLFWIAQHPEFGKQGVFLDERMSDESFVASLDDMNQLVANGVNYIAPPLWALVNLNSDNEYIESEYALLAKQAGLKIITWTLERSGPLAQGGGWYYQSIKEATQTDSDQLRLLDFLAKTVKVEGIFSDWPGTVTYYANCMGL